MILVSSCGDILNDHFCNVFTKEDLDNLPTLEASTLLDMPEITHIQNSVYVTTELELKQSSTIRPCSRSPLPRGNQRTCTSPDPSPHGLTFSWWECYGLCARHKPTKLTHSFYSVLVSVSVFMALSTVLHSINSPDNSAFSLCTSGLILPY